MELSFYQKAEQPDSSGKLMIHGRVCWLGQKVRFSTGEKVLPAHFDTEKEVVKGKAPFASHINQTLGTYRDELTNYFYRNQNSDESESLSISQVRDIINTIRISQLGKGKPVTPSLLLPEYPALHDYWQHYVNDMKASRSPEWCRSVKTVAKHLKAFRPGLAWDGLKLNTLNQFKVYLQEEEDHSDNTIHTYVGLLTGLIEYAEKNQIPVPRDYAWIETRPGKVIRPVLEESDEKLIMNATLVPPPQATTGDPNYLEKVRWYFLLACQTGLRRIDQWQYLNPVIQHIENTPCLMALQQKTGNRVAIPLSDDTYYLLRNPVTDQKPPTGENYNETLRIIGQQAKLVRPVTVGSFYKGELITEVLPLHDTMSSHMARRTFATRMTAGGLNTFLLKEIMGHESVNSTQKYTTVSNQSIVRQTLDAWLKQKDR